MSSYIHWRREFVWDDYTGPCGDGTYYIFLLVSLIVYRLPHDSPMHHLRPAPSTVQPPAALALEQAARSSVIRVHRERVLSALEYHFKAVVLSTFYNPLRLSSSSLKHLTSATEK